jgi:hypothetical protein
MVKNETKLHDLIDLNSPQQILVEIKYVLALIDPKLDTSCIEQVHADIICLFKGEYPGYQASNTKYHNLGHTCSVALALVRLTHGHIAEGHQIPSRIIELGVISSLFHDAGLIQTTDDQNGTGAQYTIGHEERSINIMKNYLNPKGFSATDIEDCSHIIMCTILELSLEEIPFRSHDIRSMGQIMGSADLIAQIADRSYLEKLPLLFMEFEEAGMEGFESPLELFKKTEAFYHSVAVKRLIEEMGNAQNTALTHFRERWGIDRDLYAEAMQKNINYSKKLESDCLDSYECLQSKLRRKV